MGNIKKGSLGACDFGQGLGLLKIEYDVGPTTIAKYTISILHKLIGLRAML